MAKVTNKQVLALTQLISKLDPGLTPENRAKSAFQFKAKVTYGLARNFKHLRAVVEDLEKARLETFKKYRVGDEETLTGEAAKKFQAEFQEVLDEEAEVKFHQINVADLELDKNFIAAEVLAELLDTIVIGEVT